MTVIVVVDLFKISINHIVTICSRVRGCIGFRCFSLLRAIDRFAELHCGCHQSLMLLADGCGVFTFGSGFQLSNRIADFSFHLFADFVAMLIELLLSLMRESLSIVLSFNQFTTLFVRFGICLGIFHHVLDVVICQAAVGMLGQNGVTVNLDAKPKAQHFPLIQNKQTDFYMLGWGVPTYDSEYIFNFLVHGRESDIGTWNGTGFDNDELDAKIKSLASNTDLEARNADIADIWRVVQDEVLYIPVHHQVLNWGMSEGVGIEVDPEDQPKVKYITMTGS